MERFCETCEAIASTTKKLEKIGILCDMKVLNIGGSTIKEAVCKASQVAEQEYLDASIRLGDEGDAAFELLRGKLSEKSDLALGDLLVAFEALAGSRAKAVKVERN